MTKDGLIRAMIPAARYILFLVIPLTLASCGSVTGLVDPSGREIEDSPLKFSKITVQDFAYSAGYNYSKAPPNAARRLPDRIALSLKRDSDFKNISRNAVPDADTLVINGVISRCEEGNGALRLLVGMGAGSTYLDSVVYFKDNTGREIGRIVSDQNSWALGGIKAALQDTEYLMDYVGEVVVEQSDMFLR